MCPVRCVTYVSGRSAFVRATERRNDHRFTCKVSNFAQVVARRPDRLAMSGTTSCFLKPWKAKAMQIPSALKPACWGAVGGAIAAMIVGFSWGGWMTGSSAGKFADQRAEAAVVAILTPICVEKFQHHADATANLVALKKISSSWEQGRFVEAGGWATRPGATSPDYVLAGACAEKLVQAKTAAR